jgi:hypothetical protein
MERHGLAVALALAIAGPAGAAITDYEVEVESVLGNTGTTRELVVLCPAGTHALGGGASVVNDAVGQPTLTRSGPTSNLSGWQATARNATAGGAAWGLEVILVCGNAYGLELVIETTDLAADDYNGATATCPEGKVLLGGGAQIFGDAEGTAVTASGPENEAVWLGSARGPGAGGGEWGLRVDAICADEPSVRLVDDFSPLDSIPKKQDFVECPGRMVALGGGGRVAGSIPPSSTLLASGPTGSFDAPSGWTTTGYASGVSWTLRTDVVCPEPASAASALAALAALAVAVSTRSRRV